MAKATKKTANPEVEAAVKSEIANALVTALRSADRAANTAFEKTRECALILMRERREGEELAKEQPRLLALAKRICEGKKIKLKQERNVWMFISNHLITLMSPDTPIEVKPANAKHGPVLKPAEKCATAREVQKAAKQIREIHGIGRTSTGESDPWASWASNVANKLTGEDSDDGIKALKRALKDKGYTLSLTKARATAKAKPKAAAKPKSRIIKKDADGTEKEIAELAKHNHKLAQTC